MTEAWTYQMRFGIGCWWERILFLKGDDKRSGN